MPTHDACGKDMVRSAGQTLDGAEEEKLNREDRMCRRAMTEWQTGRRAHVAGKPIFRGGVSIAEHCVMQTTRQIMYALQCVTCAFIL